MQHTVPMNNKKRCVSFFLHRWEKTSITLSLADFMHDVRSPRWEVMTRAHRRWLEQGMKWEAAQAKDGMPAITVAGVFRGGHAAHQVKELSGLLMLDFDHTNQRTQEIVGLLRQLPYVMAVFVSISGQGVKAMVRIDAPNPAQYARAYAIVAAEVSSLVGAPCDLACRDLGRLCSAVYDPQAYYNPQAEVFPLAHFTDPMESDREANTQPDAASTSPAAGGFIRSFLADFRGRNAFVRGSRHDFMLKLGRVARYKEFSQAELQQLIAICTETCVESDFTAAEIEKSLTAGYQYAASTGKPQNSENGVHKVQGSPLTPKPGQGAPLSEEELSGISEELRSQAPYFPEEVYRHLPPFLHRGVELARTRRERDMLLMGMIANISGCLPGVQILYDQMYFSLHLYYTAIAQAGTGKGVLALAAYLPEAIHAHYEKQSEQERTQYEEALLNWELELKEANRQKRKPNVSLKPKEPRAICIRVSPNLSKSQLIIHLRTNGKLGVIINASELDMVSSAMKQDCGKHDDVFRAAAQHEEVSSSYKTDKEQIWVYDPHLVLCLSGTPAQLAAFIASLENGMYSRIGFYTAQAQWEWHSAAPRQGGVEYRSFFRALGRELLEMHLLLLQSPTEVVFTDAQWEEHTACFSALLTGVVSEKEDSPGAIVLRHGLLAMRIAGVLTVLRKCESGLLMTPYTCTDEDFRTAMQLTNVLLEHSLLLSSSLPQTAVQVRPLQSFYQIRPVLDGLERTFSYTAFIKKSRDAGLAESTAKRWLSRAVKFKFIVKEENSYRKTGKKWEK